jgi:hypothetical protein
MVSHTPMSSPPSLRARRPSPERYGTPEDIDLAAGANLSAGWETECTLESVAEGVADLDALWKQMVEKSGLNLFDTITQGHGDIEFIAHVD